MKLHDQNGRCFTLSRFDRTTGKFSLEKAPAYYIVD